MRMRGKPMKIQRFIEKRKARCLSQSELAKGICTQFTVSRFEKKCQVPTLKILIQLCNR
ncbi:transcriptional regulator, partial [Enterococcus faecalis]